MIEQAKAVAIAAGLSPAEAAAVTADYGDAQVEALEKAMLGGGAPGAPLLHVHKTPAEQILDRRVRGRTA